MRPVRCAKCGRKLTREPVQGMGPVCARNVLGVRPKPARRAMQMDTATPDLFAQELECARRFHEAVAGVSLEMVP